MLKCNFLFLPFYGGLWIILLIGISISDIGSNNSGSCENICLFVDIYLIICYLILLIILLIGVFFLIIFIKTFYDSDTK